MYQEQFVDNILKKIDSKDKRKRKRMKVSGKSLMKLRELIINK